MNSRQISKTKKQLIFLAASCLLAVLSWQFFPTPGVYLGHWFLKPLMRGENYFYNWINNEEATLDEAERAELTALREENERLKMFASHTENGEILAGVIGRPTALPYDVLFVDKGSDDGVQVGAPVYAANMAAIGFVATIYEHNALIALISTPGYVSTVYVYGPNIYTTALGQGGGVTRIHVPQGVSLEVGNAVVMPSLARGIYGSITAVDSVPERPEQYGYMTSDIPLSSIRFVAIGTEPLSTMDFDTARSIVENVERGFLQVEVPPEALIDLNDQETSSSTPEEETATTSEESIEVSDPNSTL